MIPLKDNIPTERFPIVTVALIVANVVVYLLSIRHGGSPWSGPSPEVTIKYGAIPWEISHLHQHCVAATDLSGQVGVACGRPGDGTPSNLLTIFTGMFMHGSFLHIAGNMLFLWIFGNNVEDSMGRAKFILFYLVGGVAAFFLQDAVTTGDSRLVPTVGASGAIAAVLGGYIVLYPRARVITVIFIILFFTVLEIPALIVLGLWFVEQAVLGAAGLTSPTSGGGGVAYFAHVGGFVFGLLTIRLLARRVKSTPPRFPVY